MLSFYQVQSVTQREKLKGKTWVTIFHLHGAQRNSDLEGTTPIRGEEHLHHI